jgi:hypothetical protein
MYEVFFFWGRWISIHSKERKSYLNYFWRFNLYTSSDVIRMIKSKKMKWAGYVACMGEMVDTIFYLENLKGRDHSEDLGVDGRIILG